LFWPSSQTYYRSLVLSHVAYSGWFAGGLACADNPRENECNEGRRTCRDRLALSCAFVGNGEDVNRWVVAEDCATIDAECYSGSCVLPDEECPEGRTSVCLNNAVHRCWEGKVGATGEQCGALTCFDLGKEAGARSQCLKSIIPCDNSHCDGQMAVTCQDGFQSEETLCEAPTSRCRVQGIAVCEDPNCPVEGSSTCYDNASITCPNGIVRLARDCSAQGEKCVQLGGNALCAQWAQAREVDWVSISAGMFNFIPSTGGSPMAVSIPAFEITKTELTWAHALKLD
jgi:hypothetical protein